MTVKFFKFLHSVDTIRSHELIVVRARVIGMAKADKGSS